MWKLFWEYCLVYLYGLLLKFPLWTSLAHLYLPHVNTIWGSVNNSLPVLDRVLDHDTKIAQLKEPSKLSIKPCKSIAKPSASAHRAVERNHRKQSCLIIDFSKPLLPGSCILGTVVETRVETVRINHKMFFRQIIHSDRHSCQTKPTRCISCSLPALAARRTGKVWTRTCRRHPKFMVAQIF